jgi:hypothetical protein
MAGERDGYSIYDGNRNLIKPRLADAIKAYRKRSLHPHFEGGFGSFFTHILGPSHLLIPFRDSPVQINLLSRSSGLPFHDIAANT